jgi:glycosyltransferase involved in cell wall biosynthesis
MTLRLPRGAAPAAETPTMRIAFIEPHLELYGGIRRVMELSNRLVRLGDDVTIFHPSGAPCSWMEGVAKTRPTSELAGEAFDAVIFNDPPHYELALRARARVKAFYILCLDDRERLEKYSLKILWPRRGRIMALQRALSLPFLKIANATWMQLYLAQELAVEAELLIGGVNREVFRPVPADRSPGVFRILCSGDPRERKGTDTIREAFEMVRRDHPSVELSTYHGKGIPQERMAEAYCSADLFVDAQWYAGWNNPVAEAMACGVPVVCTDIGGVADFAFHEETAVLVPVGRVERLASAIRRMIADGDLRERMRQNAFRAVARFDWDVSARRLRQLLERR